MEVGLPLRPEHRLVLAQRERLLDEDEDQRRAEQVEDEPVEADVGRVVGEVVDRHLVAAERERQADQDERRQREPARPAHDDVEERERARQHQRPEQQQPHRVDVVRLPQLGRRQVLGEVEGEHAQEAERRQHQGDHARGHSLARLKRAVRFAQAVQLVDVLLHGVPGLPRRRPPVERANYCAATRAGAASAGVASASRTRSRHATWAAIGAGAGMAPLTIAWIAHAVVAASLLRRRTGAWRRMPSCAGSDRSLRADAADVDVEALQAARVGDRLAFGAAHQDRVGVRSRRGSWRAASRTPGACG